jgi:hypothetical protein
MLREPYRKRSRVGAHYQAQLLTWPFLPYAEMSAVYVVAEGFMPAASIFSYTCSTHRHRSALTAVRPTLTKDYSTTGHAFITCGALSSNETVSNVPVCCVACRPHLERLLGLPRLVAGRDHRVEGADLGLDALRTKRVDKSWERGDKAWNAAEARVASPA